MALGDLSKKKKIEEEVIKENLNFYGLLQNQIVTLKQQVEMGENSRVQEKANFVEFIENFKQILEQLRQRVSHDRRKYEEDIEFYKRLSEEKDLQHEEQIVKLKVKYEKIIYEKGFIPQRKGLA